MSLPIDRTTKAALDANLVNGNTSDAPVIKNSNDVVYNTIDELNAKVDGLVTTGTLSQASVTPVANKIAQRDANGNVVNAFPVSNRQNPNLLFNPSARLGISTGWTIVGGGSAWAASFGQNGEGGYFAVSSASATGAPFYLESSKIPVTVGVAFNISGEIYTKGQTAGAAQIEIHAFNSSNVDLGMIANIAAPNGSDWTRYSASGTTPVNTSYITVRLIYTLGSISTNTAYAKIKVEYGPYATTFSDDNTLNTQQYGSVLGLAQILSGGYKIGSGQTSAQALSSTAVSIPITFTTPFSTIPIVICSTDDNATSTYTAHSINVTATGFTLVLTGSSGATSGRWVAFGS